MAWLFAYFAKKLVKFFALATWPVQAPNKTALVGVCSALGLLASPLPSGPAQGLSAKVFSLGLRREDEKVGDLTLTRVAGIF